MCLTLAFVAENYAIAATDRLQFITGLPDGLIVARPIGGKLQRIRNGWLTGGGCGVFFPAALQALEEADASDTAAVAAALESTVRLAPPTGPNWITTVFHDGTCFQAVTFVDARVRSDSR